MAIIDSFISNLLLALACLSAILLYRYYQPGASNRFYRIVYAVVITFIVTSSIKWLLQHYYSSKVEYLEFVKQSMPIRFVFSLMMLSFVTILNWLWSSIEEKSKQALKQSEVEQLLKEAELLKLRQQLQPHFLFNSLNSISALAINNPQLARKMIQQLSDFLRGTIKKDDQETVLLREELTHLNLYLDIEKVRFGERLMIQLDCPSETLIKKIPPLLLQPIVENAIKFGLYGTLKQVTIVIEAEINGQDLYIKVFNSFDTETVKSNSGTGFGLKFIERRLFLLFGQNNLLTTSSEANLYTTQIIIPQGL
jgi:LytS/YehU family sensor histidine kinase